jgi:hypothetical protein
VLGEHPTKEPSKLFVRPFSPDMLILSRYLALAAQ